MKLIENGVETDVARIAEELRQYSITPETLVLREFRTNATTDFSFLDRFENRGNEVSRFGINGKIIPVEILDDKAENSKVKILGQEFKACILKTGAPSVKTSISKYAKPDAEAVTHHELEKDVFVEAIKHLLTSDQRTVIVDIFARVSGAIKIQDGEVEIHSVLLYKNPVSASGKFEIVVIDPNNFVYSSHLLSADMITKLAERGLPVEIKTHHKQVQIYRPDPEKVGFGADLFRDCIDVCVKLAFGFNALADHVPLDLEKVNKHEVVVSISNFKGMDIYIFECPYPVRVKQSSDVRVVKTFMVLEKILAEEEKIMLSVKADLGVPKLIEDLTNVMSKATDKTCLTKLNDISIAARKVIEAYLHHDEAEITGDITTLMSEL